MTAENLWNSHKNSVFIQDSFLPTMPDDNTSMVIQALTETNLKQYCKFFLMKQRDIE